jgi:hypothetical protein
MTKGRSASVGAHIGLASLRTILKTALNKGYAFVHYENVDQHDKCILMRHDVDVDVRFAVEVAGIESSFGVSATYFLMLRNPLYNLLSSQIRECVAEMVNLGHHIALHFDVSQYPGLEDRDLLPAITAELALMREILPDATLSRCVSFHKPSAYFLSSEIETDAFFGAYNRRFFRDMRYIADSGGRWREESILELIERDDTAKIHFNSHPIWWVSPGATVQDKLNGYLIHRLRHADAELADVLNDTNRGAMLHQPKTFRLQDALD